MCGRYTIYEPDELEGRFDAKSVSPVKPNYNAAPSQVLPVITVVDGNKEIHTYHWGIPRVLGKDLVKVIINTRSDKAFGNFWKKNVMTKRCLVPANGFFEWQKNKDGKVPYFIHLEDRELYAFAGIWNTWKNDDGSTMNAYSIMTTTPNDEMSSIHDRMPVILSQEDESLWLDDAADEGAIESLLRPMKNGSLITEEWTTAINNVKNNSSQLLGL